MEAAPDTIKKAHMQQIVDLVWENLLWELNGSKSMSTWIFRRIADADLTLSPTQIDDHHHQVQDPLEEVNLRNMDNPKFAYISSLLDDELKGQV